MIRNVPFIAGRTLDQGRYVLVTVVLLLVLVLSLAMPVVAQSDDDTTPPTVATAERGNDTTIVLTIADDDGVDESSVSSSDFTVDPGLIRDVSVNESGSNATVAIYLTNPVDSDDVTVSLRGSVSDDSGNAVSEGAATATGMDGKQPRLQRFEIVRSNETHGRIVIESSERLGDLSHAVNGRDAASLDIRNFTETSPTSGTYRYTRVHEFTEEGEYTLILLFIEDEGGNDVHYNARREYLVDWTAPTASIDGPVHVTVGDTHTFSSGASDFVGIESVQWEHGANATDAGQRSTHTFTEPGNRTITVTVTDGRGNVATARHDVTVVHGASKDGVDTSVRSANRTNATVYADRTARRVRIANPQGEIVSTDGVTVNSLTVTPPANETLWLSIVLDRQAVAFTTATGRRSIASFAIQHPPHDSAANVTVAFSVDRLRLQAAGLAPDEVALYRENSSWNELPTRVHWRGEDEVIFYADSPGLSAFAIGASNETSAENESEDTDTTDETTDSEEGSEQQTTTPTPTPTPGGTDDVNRTDDESANGTSTPTETPTAPSTETPTPAADPAELVVTSATLLDDDLEAREYAIVRATVANRGGQTGTRTVELSAGGSAVETRPVTVPPGEERTVQFTYRVDESVQLAVDETAAGTVLVEGEGATERSSNRTGTVSENPEQSGGGLPNPLALWPGGLLGTVLGAVVGLSVVTYGALKGLAIYLGY